MPKHQLYSTHGRNQRHGEVNEKSNKRPDSRTGSDHLVSNGKGRGPRGSHAQNTVTVLRSGTVSGRPDVSGGLKNTCIVIRYSVQIGLHPPTTPFRGAVQC
jgi:hypothetical protein